MPLTSVEILLIFLAAFGGITLAVTVNVVAKRRLARLKANVGQLKAQEARARREALNPRGPGTDIFLSYAAEDRQTW